MIKATQVDTHPAKRDDTLVSLYEVYITFQKIKAFSKHLDTRFLLTTAARFSITEVHLPTAPPTAHPGPHLHLPYFHLHHLLTTFTTWNHLLTITTSYLPHPIFISPFCPPPSLPTPYFHHPHLPYICPHLPYSPPILYICFHLPYLYPTSLASTPTSPISISTSTHISPTWTPPPLPPLPPSPPLLTSPPLGHLHPYLPYLHPHLLPPLFLTLPFYI